MGAVSTIVDVLGFDERRWERIGPWSLWTAAAWAASASGVLSVDRFGGLIVDAPRAFLRATLIGVYGWLGLAAAVWVLAGQVTSRARGRQVQIQFQHTVAAVGMAHVPLLVLGLVIFVAANIFRVLGPGLVVAVFVFAFWFPAVLAVAVRHSHRLTLARATALVAAPYLVWFLLVGRRLLSQVQHLL